MIERPMTVLTDCFKMQHHMIMMNIVIFTSACVWSIICLAVMAHSCTNRMINC